MFGFLVKAGRVWLKSAVFVFCVMIVASIATIILEFVALDARLPLWTVVGAIAGIVAVIVAEPKGDPPY